MPLIRRWSRVSDPNPEAVPPASPAWWPRLGSTHLQKDSEQTVMLAPFLSTEMYAITTVEDAFPIMQRVYG